MATSGMDVDTRDSELVLAARAGDRGAFAALLERHRPLLLTLCERALRDPGLAQDAAQEAALQAMLGLDRLRRPDRFGAWLAGIGLNVCRRWLRQRSRETWSWEAIQGGRRGIEPADRRAGPDELAEEADLARQVRHAVAGLPPGQRSAVALFYLAGLTHAETAALLGIEVGAVKTRLHKARATLRRQLWETWKEIDMATADTPHLIEMRVADVRRGRKRSDGDRHASHLVLLEEIGGTRRLPIWMDEFEATAIALHLEQVAFPRPLTFAFAAGLFQAAGGRLREVRIDRLIDDTFYATAVVDGPQGQKTLDARPSDALNLALLLDAPIRVDRAVLAIVEAAAEGRPLPLVREGSSIDDLAGPAEIVAEVIAGWSGSGPETPASSTSSSSL